MLTKLDNDDKDIVYTGPKTSASTAVSGSRNCKVDSGGRDNRKRGGSGRGARSSCEGR